MGGYLILIVGALNLGSGISFLLQGKIGMAVCMICYGIANGGLYAASSS